jgi:hypothetical protein
LGKASVKSARSVKVLPCAVSEGKIGSPVANADRSCKKEEV